MQVDSGTAGLDVVSPVKTGSLEAEAWMDEVLDDVAACSSLTGRRPKAARHYTYENRVSDGLSVGLLHGPLVASVDTKSFRPNSRTWKTVLFCCTVTRPENSNAKCETVSKTGSVDSHHRCHSRRLIKRKWQLSRP